MFNFVQRHDNFLWLVACAADRMRPDSVPEHYSDHWQTFVFQGVCQLKCDFWDIRWDCVRSYAINRMYHFLIGKPYPH